LATGILAINNCLQTGLSLRQGTIVDATIIHAPSSTKNKEGKRDPEMHQTKKGNQYCVTNTGRMTCDAVPKMEVGLPKSACRSRLQTTRCCCIQKVRW
jgi:IS5 family transposase